MDDVMAIWAALGLGRIPAWVWAGVIGLIAGYIAGEYVGMEKVERWRDEAERRLTEYREKDEATKAWIQYLERIGGHK